MTAKYKKLEPGFELEGTVRLIEVGQRKVSTTVQVSSESDFWKAVSPILLSPVIEYLYDPVKNEGTLFAWYKPAGTFERIFN